MPNRQSKSQKETIERVMHEFKEGELKIRGTGPKVKNPKQAIAIALHEAGASNQESPAKNRSNERRTKAKERKGETAQAEKEGKRAQDRTMAKATATERKPASKASSRAAGKSAAKSPSAAKPASKSASRSAYRPRPARASADEQSKSVLYAEARRRDVPGRSKMSKAQLQRALHH